MIQAALDKLKNTDAPAESEEEALDDMEHGEEEVAEDDATVDWTQKNLDVCPQQKNWMF